MSEYCAQVLDSFTHIFPQMKLIQVKKAIPVLHASTFDHSGYNGFLFVCSKVPSPVALMQRQFFSFRVLASDAECSKLSSIIKCAVIVKYDLSLSAKRCKIHDKSHQRNISQDEESDYRSSHYISMFCYHS